ncbi:Uncharacterised protein [Escherichia coli]|uniref:Uncharacterized protein n=1 Tax=Escherichia coli TaxID=562 RepID=A0A377C6H2_ECOLX|nr:Uncharacterised protein [Escherichia coli]
MHPLTHPLPVTAHVSLLDKNSLTPARASVNGTTRTSDQDFESVYAHCQSGKCLRANWIIIQYMQVIKPARPCNSFSMVLALMR